MTRAGLKGCLNVFGMAVGSLKTRLRRLCWSPLRAPIDTLPDCRHSDSLDIWFQNSYAVFCFIKRGLDHASGISATVRPRRWPESARDIHVHILSEINEQIKINC